MSDTVQVPCSTATWCSSPSCWRSKSALPIPAVPVLLGVGALAGAGRMSLVPALAVALVASLPPDIIWYELGRRGGGRLAGCFKAACTSGGRRR